MPLAYVWPLSTQRITWPQVVTWIKCRWENNVKVNTQKSNPGGWTQTLWSVPEQPLRGGGWRRGRSSTHTPAAHVPNSICPKGSHSLAGDCCFSIKHVCIRCSEYTTLGSEALSLLTELLSVSTKKESVFWLPGRVRCSVHKELFLPPSTLAFYTQKFWSKAPC